MSQPWQSRRYIADIAGIVAAMTESELDATSEKTSHHALGLPRPAAAEALAGEPVPRGGQGILPRVVKRRRACRAAVKRRWIGGSVGCRRAFTWFVAETTFATRTTFRGKLNGGG